MKDRLNITVDQVLIEQVKRYASKHNTSISQLVEVYFKSLTRPTHKKTVIELLKELPKPKGKLTHGDLKKTYFESRKTKYGF